MTGDRGCVLVVDDQEDARTSLAEILRIEGYRVAAAADGQEALEYLRSHPSPNVILLDLMMPGMNGWEFRRRQLADPATAPIPVAVISGADLSEQNQSLLQAVGHFVKPLQIERVLETVAACCGTGA
ncbi:MAG TPA: response regulator [Armatimonadota bacterium]|nr:response regulator [Armatimonadota bacterium]